MRHLKHHDATTQEFDVDALNAEIAQIETDQSTEYTKLIRHLLTKHKKICNPLDEVPIKRAGLEHAIDLDPVEARLSDCNGRCSESEVVMMSESVCAMGASRM